MLEKRKVYMMKQLSVKICAVLSPFLISVFVASALSGINYFLFPDSGFGYFVSYLALFVGLLGTLCFWCVVYAERDYNNMGRGK